MTAHRPIRLSLALAFIMLSLGSHADEPSVTLTRHEGHFSPTPLTIPRDQKIRLLVDNQDDDAMEFESESLSWEIVIPPHHATALHIGPLNAGHYDYFNDNNPQEKGRIVVR